jgi:hypothetical protein
MDLVEEITELIASKTSFITGVDLFPETFPIEPSFCIVVNLLEGPRELDNYAKNQLYITVRSDLSRRVDASTVCRDLLTIMNRTQDTLTLGKIMWTEVQQGCKLVLTDPSARSYYQGMLLMHFAYNDVIGGDDVSS